MSCSVGQVLNAQCSSSEAFPKFELWNESDKKLLLSRVEAAVCRPLSGLETCCIFHCEEFMLNYKTYQRNRVGCCNPLLFHAEPFLQNLEEIDNDLQSKVEAVYPFLLLQRFICRSCKFHVTESIEISPILPSLVDETYSYEKIQTLSILAQTRHGTNIENVLRPMQAESIHKTLMRKDLLCVLPTNSGKTLILVLPSLIIAKITSSKQICIIVSPLLTLMEDLIRRLGEWNLTGIIINKEDLISGRVKSFIDDAEDDTAVYLIASPEILSTSEMRNVLRTTEIHQIQIDEVHMTVLWGKKFRPSFSGLSNLRHFSDCPVGIYTATFKESMMQQVIDNTGLEKKNLAVVSASPDRPEIFLELRKRGEFKEDYEFLKNEVDEFGVTMPRTLVFVNTIAKTDELNIDFRALLSDRGRVYRNEELWDYISDHFSASSEPFTHERILSSFADPFGCLRILFATVSYGMGVDNKTIRRVILHDMETDPLLLFQKIGRSCRDGKAGKAILYSSSDTYGALMKKGDCIRHSILSKLMGYEEPVLTDPCTCTLGLLCVCKSCVCCSNCKLKCQCRKNEPVYESMEVEEEIVEEEEAFY